MCWVLPGCITRDGTSIKTGPASEQLWEFYRTCQGRFKLFIGRESETWVIRAGGVSEQVSGLPPCGAVHKRGHSFSSGFKASQDE